MVVFVLLGIGRLGRHALLVAEGAHARFFTAEGVDAVPFDINNEEAREVIVQVERDAEAVVTAVLQTMQQVRELVRRHNADDFSLTYSDIELAGMILAAGAYKGMSRKSGRDYYNHPHEVATIIKIAVEKMGRVDQAMIDDLLFLAYSHDAFEDMFSNEGGSYVGASEVLVSPLVAKKAVEALGSTEGDAVANSLMLMSKPIGPSGKMPYMAYIERGLNDVGFVITKIADVRHNKIIEPKIAVGGDADEMKVRAKNGLYREAEALLLNATNRFPTTELMFLAHAVANVSKTEIQERLLRKTTLSHLEMAQILSRNLKRLRGEDQL